MLDKPTTTPPHSDLGKAGLMEILDRQRAAHLAAGPLSAAARIEWLDRLIGLVVDNHDEIAHVLSVDFGGRSREATLLADVVSVLGSLKQAKANLEDWMQPVACAGMFPDAVARVEYHPLGVVGAISPWNFPFALSFAPLAGIVAAGNRCMIKPSELTPASSALIARMIASAFDASEIAVVTGGAETGRAFAELPFDHLLFTGSGSVGRHVMRAAATTSYR